MPRTLFDPRLSERLKMRYQLDRSPADVEEFLELGRALVERNSELKAYIEKIKSGEVIVGETEIDRGQSVRLPDGREANVMCGYDALTTLILRGRGVFNASCLHCGEKMKIDIEEGKVASASSPSIVYWLGDGPKGIPLCDHLNLFPDRKHLELWLEKNPEELGVPIPLKGAVELLRELHTY